MAYHRPVLLAESIEGLKIQSSGTYVDATFGGGGHSKAILTRLDDNGHLFAFDQDEDARQNVWVDKRLTFVQSNFRYLAEYLHYYGVAEVHGVMADLGVSSWQFDNPERGFSYRQDQALDMRMNRQLQVRAADIIAQYPREELVRMFSAYGEVRNARTLATRICSVRDTRRINSVAEFLDAIGPCVRGHRPKYLAQVFQALRIEVNDEMGALRDFLQAATGCLAAGGRLVVISYHSVEDRLVKHWFRSGRDDGIIEQDDYGRVQTPFTLITRRPIIPDQKEIEQNSRARSARLRIAEKK
ncbi:MAG: 16S rRNA (cytosine(1402)-N(4))-methyltransferase RsmH [Saprospiraceae bacterium]|nr:16S rRNA (cytosine(1402)-N(4))-methyltransferase RsmH [Saprospiraceae bacterium]